LPDTVTGNKARKINKTPERREKERVIFNQQWEKTAIVKI